jgi:uncharacterized protein YabN with tetrapyrrole methylase and pyrophosphatase domain
MDDTSALSNDPLTHAWNIQTDAAALGFDWPDVQGVFLKLHEEIGEVQEALQSGDQEHARREVGDLLFSAVNLARFLNADPAAELRHTNARFSHRFALVQDEVKRSGRSITTCSLAELDAIWDAVKARGH